MTLKQILNKTNVIVKKQGIVIAFLVVTVFFSVTTKSFFTYRNIALILRQVSILGIIACGMTFVIIAGNWDLSVGSLTSLTTVLVISLHDKIGPIPAIIFVLIAGLLFGIFSGYLVGFLKLNSIIVTLGMMSIIQAITLIYTGGKYTRIVAPEETWFGFIGRGFVLRIPFPVILYAIFIVIFSIILNKTVFGRQVRAVGGNYVASLFSGIRANKVVMITFIMTGITSAIGGIILGSRMMAAQNYIGSGYELQVITGVILGGTSLAGGEGKIEKTFLGILIIGVLNNGLIMIGFPYYIQWVIQGLIIIGVVWMDATTKRGEV